MLYIAYFIIMSCHNIPKNVPKIFHFILVRVGKQFMHRPNAIEPPTNSNFEAFGEGGRGKGKA